jgi:hypothetical protein
MVSSQFEASVKRCGMSDVEIRRFISDFTNALVGLTLQRIRTVDLEAQGFAHEFDLAAGALDWSDEEALRRVGIDPVWLAGMPNPHRTYLHPAMISEPDRWGRISAYVECSMVSDKQAKALFPHLKRSRRPNVAIDHLYDEAAKLNGFFRLVQEANLTGDRVISYRGDLRTHGQVQNDSGRIGAVGAVIAILDALDEISPGCVSDTHGTMPLRTATTPKDVVAQIAAPDFTMPQAILLKSQRAIIFSADPDVAIVAPIGGKTFDSAQDAYNVWKDLKRATGAERGRRLHQAALGEVKTALDPANLHERLALGPRETRSEVMASRFLLMAILTEDIVDPDREGRRALHSKDAGRFEQVFNLYFAWGYDGARSAHSEHWQDFKNALKGWTDL